MFIVLICIIDVTATIKSGQPLNSSLTDIMMLFVLSFSQLATCFIHSEMFIHRHLGFSVYPAWIFSLHIRLVQLYRDLIFVNDSKRSFEILTQPTPSTPRTLTLE